MLPQSQIDIIINAMLPYNPVRIGIFGSVARGEDSENSDVDILYQLKEVIKFTNLLRLHEELEQKLNRKVDLVSEKYAHPKLKPYIMKDLKIIYSNET
ncbi:MAG: nucleotidyltransferase [Bacteroidia bacterium 44-10]|jgi:predicted nucleotidyltransferase|nr:MAG: nucleotidyltransferase [Bacteroidia bacterium 44-10]